MRIATLVTLLITTGAFAQARNAAYLEVGGNGVLPTVNYERQLSERLFGRVGLSFIYSETSDGDEDLTFAIPLAVNYLTHPAGNHHFEAGAGLTLITGDAQELWDDDEDEEISNVVGTANFGYRYQKPGRGFVFRAGFTPLVFDGEVQPWIGLTAGYRW